jgi:hypothetical protein
MAHDEPEEEQVKIIFRTDGWMRDRLKAVARSNRRSMNAEITFRLEQSLREKSQDHEVDAILAVAYAEGGAWN